jgi:hypothetical protein
MCRSIKPLFNFDPAATDAEIEAAALQFARKLSGFSKPSSANQEATNKAVREFSHTARHLLESLSTRAEPKNREIEANKAKLRSSSRFE